jgi:hypothetical protein
MALIAKVTVVTMVDGKRREFAPGEDLGDDLHPHDIATLKAMGSIEDTAETERAANVAAAADKKALGDFNEARLQVQAAAESTSAAGGKVTKAPAGKKADGTSDA